MAFKLLVNVAGLHKIFNVDGSTYNTTSVKESTEYTGAELFYIKADEDDEQYGYKLNSLYIWAKGNLYNCNDSKTDLSNYYNKLQIDASISEITNIISEDETLLAVVLNDLSLNKQNKLIAGEGIIIDASNKISASIDLSTLATKELLIEDEYIVAKALNKLNNNKQDKLTAGEGIIIDASNKISASVDLSALASKEYVNAKIDILDASTNNKINNLSDSINSKINNLDASTNNKINNLSDSINSKINNLDASIIVNYTTKNELKETELVLVQGLNVLNNSKQDKLIAGEGIIIDASNKISASVDLSALASKEYVNAKIVDLDASIVTNYTTKEELNKTEYIFVKTIVDLSTNKQGTLTAGNNITIDNNNTISANINLSNYATKTDVANSIATEDTNIKNWVNNKGYATTTQLTNAINTEDISVKNWANLTFSTKNELTNLDNKKQDKLIEGSGIDISNNIISIENFKCNEIIPTTTNFVDGSLYSVYESLLRTANLFEGYKNEITEINGKLGQCSTTNTAADKAFVNSTVASNAANFRGSWHNWNEVPVDASDYPLDYSGKHTPTNNDYLVVLDASDFSAEHTGTWRYMYVGKWEDDGKGGVDKQKGWRPQYRVGSAFTVDLMAAIDSKITREKVLIYDTSYNVRITSLETDKLNKVYSTGKKVYGVDKDGAQKMYTAGEGIILTDDGQITVNGDLTSYATKNYVDTSINNVYTKINELDTSIINTYATKAALNDDEFVIATAIADLSTNKQDILIAGTNITIDASNKISANIDLTSYATKEYANTLVASEDTSIQNWVNNKGYATTTQLTNAINIEDTSIQNWVNNKCYALDASVNAKFNELDSSINNKFIEVINDTNIKISELDSSVANTYATKRNLIDDELVIATAIADLSTNKQGTLTAGTNITIDASNKISANIDLSSYATTEYVNSNLNTLNSSINDKFVELDASIYNALSAEDVSIQSWVNNKGYALDASVNVKFNELDSSIIINYVTKKELDDTEFVIATAITDLSSNKQNNLVAGTNITIDASNNIISAIDTIYNDIELRNLINKEKQDRISVDTSLQNNINTKLNIIADLDTIRSGAALGATAIQQHQDISGKADTTYVNNTFATDLNLSIDNSTYVITAQLKNNNGNIGTAKTIDLPLESVVVSGTYDATSKEVVLTLKNGSEIRFSVADLVSGLQKEITADNKLSATLVSGLANVAISGNYNDLTNTPTSLSNFTDNLGTNPVHTHEQYAIKIAVDSSIEELKNNLIDDELVIATAIADLSTNKQGILTAGNNITIDASNKISANIDLANYTTKDYVDTLVASEDTSIQNWVNNKGYALDASLILKLDALIAGTNITIDASNKISANIDLASYATKEYVISIDASMQNYVNTKFNDLDSSLITNYATKEDLDDTEFVVATAITDLSANKQGMLIAGTNITIDASNKISANIDLASYASKEYVDDSINNALAVEDTSIQNWVNNKGYALDASVNVKFADLNSSINEALNTEDTSIQNWVNNKGYALDANVNTKFNELDSSIINKYATIEALIDDEEVISLAICDLSTNKQGKLTAGNNITIDSSNKISVNIDLANYATKEYVDENISTLNSSINNIDTSINNRFEEEALAVATSISVMDTKIMKLYDTSNLADGTYTLLVVISGGIPTFSWVLNS